MRSHADVPMAALWTFGRKTGPNPSYVADMKGAASVAHIYGQNLVAAESMTSALAPWAYAPNELRRIIDLEFATGINRPVVHTSVHQPVDDKVPGLSLMIFGQYFNRHESWANMARPWIDYIARTGYMLQQGRNVADVAVFYGEDSPLTALFDHGVPADLPRRHAYDFVNPDVLINQLSVDGGDLVARSGARYRALQLAGTSQRMTLATLRRIAALVDAGAMVIGAAPASSPALMDNPAEFSALRARLWGPNGAGQGRVIVADHVDSALAARAIRPDFSYSGGGAEAEILSVHRTMANGDIYFINNRRNRAEQVDAHFRITGARPELWNAITGTAQPLSYTVRDGETIVPLTLGAEDAVFVVFRPMPMADQAVVPTVQRQSVLTLNAPWDVRFQAERGAPAQTRMAQLQPLDQNADAGIRYFSGTATYSTRFALPRGTRRGAPLWINLGTVGDVAEVRVNGVVADTSWFGPHRMDISRLVRAGTNQLEVRVANLWVNRLIWDRQP
ncbi:MAG: glycosyl hydrolase, partial [Sphingopyxis sp.]